MPSSDSSDSNGTHTDLPTEVLLHIFKNAHSSDFVALSRCSRLLHQIYNPLLYRDLHLHTPIQLAKLSTEENVFQLLGNTESMIIDDWAISLDAWDEISDSFADTRPMQCLIKVWKAMPSLRWLQVRRSELPCAELANDLRGYPNPRHNIDDDGDELPSLANDPTFLPRIAFVIFQARCEPNRWSHIPKPLWFLIHGRRLRYSAETHNTGIFVNINHGPLTSALEGSLAPFAPEFNWRAPGRRLAEFIDSALRASPPSRLDLQKIALSFDSFGNSVDARDIYAWTMDLLAKLGPIITPSGIRRLYLHFRDETIPDELFKINEQDSFSRLIDRIPPELYRVGLSFGDRSLRMDWVKISLTPEKRRLHPNFPPWAPNIVDPFKSKIYAWWTESLSLKANIVGIRNLDNIQDLASKLHQAFQLAYRNDDPSQAMIVQDLRQLFSG